MFYLLITTDPLTEGFTYHTKTPLITQYQINPVTGHSLQYSGILPTSRVMGIHIPQKPADESADSGITSNKLCPLYSVSLVHVIHNWVFCHLKYLCNNIIIITMQSNIENYRLTHQIPKGCVPPLCDFFMGISTNDNNRSFIDFTLEGRANGWVAVGFSNTSNMVASYTLLLVLLLKVVNDNYVVSSMPCI